MHFPVESPKSTYSLASLAQFVPQLPGVLDQLEGSSLVGWRASIILLIWMMVMMMMIKSEVFSPVDAPAFYSPVFAPLPLSLHSWEKSRLLPFLFVSVLELLNWIQLVQIDMY